MTAVQSSIVHRRLRAPSERGRALIDPSWPEAEWMLAANRENLAERTQPLADQTMVQLAQTARRDLLEKAIDYTRQYRDLSTIFDRTNINLDLTPDSYGSAASMPLILSGHQPQLFHPGVWFKNFVLHRLGQSHQGIAINLLIDVDLVQQTAIRLPTGSADSPRLTHVAFDRSGEGSHSHASYELRTIHDRETFDHFPIEVTRQLRGLISHPVVNRLWPAARHAADRGQPLGACLAEARHQLEGDWGLKTLEVPLSTLCDTPSFYRFAVDILTNLPRFFDIHNSALDEFRQAHRIRSRSHPVPELRQADDWLEAPFWLLSHEATHREKLWVRRAGGEVQLRAGEQAASCQVLFHAARIEDAVEQLTQLRKRGIRLRPRALTTTMYARLLLSDLFVHGIGGSKYDQLTDAIIERFWQCEPPNYMTVTATMKLPLSRRPSVADDPRRIDDLLRQLHYHPDRYVDMLPDRSPQVDHLVRQKHQLIDNRPLSGSRHDWHQQIEATNDALRTFLQNVRESLHDQRRRLTDRIRRDQLLGSREFSFCIFPEEMLQQTLGELAWDS